MSYINILDISGLLKATGMILNTIESTEELSIYLIYFGTYYHGLSCGNFDN